MLKILYCDDDAAAGGLISGQLRAYGKETEWVRTVGTFTDGLKSGAFELGILNAWVEGLPGILIGQQIREVGEPALPTIPLLIVGPDMPLHQHLVDMRRLNIEFCIKYRPIREWIEKIERMLFAKHRRQTVQENF